ncbi:TonB family protein [secondary endosymbiont of Ctenarytaina eucalypti]|nr:TonB family protein [secondary endosymbiont of Ctenarytaina eucalypti]
MIVMLNAPKLQQEPMKEAKPAPKRKPKPKSELRQKERRPQKRPPKIYTKAQYPITTASNGLKNVNHIPRAILRINPIYPLQARALGIQGNVSVIYDVNIHGRVRNVRIVFSQPRNMFERDIRLAMHRWTYETGKPANNMIVKFQFDLKGVRYR